MQGPFVGDRPDINNQNELEVVASGCPGEIGVADLAKAKAHFESKGLPIIAGTMPYSFAIAPEANFGLLFEFALKP